MRNDSFRLARPDPSFPGAMQNADVAAASLEWPVCVSTAQYQSSLAPHSSIKCHASFPGGIFRVRV